MEYYTLEDLQSFWTPALSKSTAQRIVFRYGKDSGAVKMDGRWQIPNNVPKIMLHEIFKKECVKIRNKHTFNFVVPDVKSDAVPTKYRRTTALPFTVDEMVERLRTPMDYILLSWIVKATGIPRGTLNTAAANDSSIRTIKGPVRVHRDDVFKLLTPYFEERYTREDEQSSD